MSKIAIVDNSSIVKSAFEEAVSKALEAIGQAGEKNAKKEITKAVYDQSPAKSGYKRTGNLRNSLTHASDGEFAYIGTNVEYAPYVELGTGKYVQGGRQTPWKYKDEKGWHVTSGMPPRPFLKPAVENYMDEYEKITKDFLKKN